MATPDLTVAFEVDTTGYLAAIRRARLGTTHLWSWTRVQPPTRKPGQTARQYRAARRRYARTLKAIRRNR